MMNTRATENSIYNLLTILSFIAATSGPVKSDRPTSMQSSTKVPTVIALVANNQNSNGTSQHHHQQHHPNDTHNNNNNKSMVTTRKDSFGSKDSLTDSGIVTGNVAAHRRSLESKATTDPAVVDKPPRKSFPTTSTSNEKMSELRKSLECLDEKKQLPPPVLTKKPSVPVKKSPISGVTSNLLSGLKSKVTSSSSTSLSSRHSTTSETTKDNLDGGGLSRMQMVADNSEKHVQLVSMHADFDHVERGTGVLKDMRANRAKLPKGRRPPSTANNNSSTDLPQVLNGSTGSMDDSGSMSQSQHSSAGHLSSQSEDELQTQVKPKPREWEKNRAPWMAELKLSQMKKTSPSSLDLGMSKSPDATRGGGSMDEHHHHQQQNSAMFTSMTAENTSQSLSTTTTTSTTSTTNQSQQHEKFDMSKSFSSSYVSSSSAGLGPAKAAANSSSSHTASTTATAGKRLESSSSMDVQNKSGGDSLRSKSMIMPIVGGQRSEESSMTSTATITSSNTATQQQQQSSRPTSVNLRNSIPPISSAAAFNRQTSNSSIAKATAIGGSDFNAPAEIITAMSTTNGIGATKDATDSQRIAELEGRVLKLEGTVQNLVRLLRDETDKVKTLKSELEKYAQCVTQV